MIPFIHPIRYILNGFPDTIFTCSNTISWLKSIGSLRTGKLRAISRRIETSSKIFFIGQYPRIGIAAYLFNAITHIFLAGMVN